MDRFFKYFKVPFIVTAVIMVICIIIRVSAGKEEEIYRHNESDLTNNVFDYAGVLEDEYVNEMELFISEIEEEVKCDIAVVILNESLEGRYSSSAEYWVRNYADNFSDSHNMGYDKAHGNNIVFIDNIYREPSTGRVYSWISTQGLAKERMTTSECEDIMNRALEDLTDDSTSAGYYSAYREVVRLIPSYVSSSSAVGSVGNSIKASYIVIASLIIAAIYVFVNWSSKLGTRTTSSTTYVENGKPNITRRQDIFLRKSVSKRKIETSSGGGGGGGGHGGGGHSR